MSGTNIPDLWPPYTCDRCGQVFDGGGAIQAGDFVLCRPCRDKYADRIAQIRRQAIKREAQPKKYTATQFSLFVAYVVLAAIGATFVALAVWTWRVALGW